MTGLFQLSGGVRRDSAVEAWMEAREPVLGACARRWFDRLRACGDDVRELLHDDCPTVCVGGAAFAYVGVYRAHVNVGFFHGAELPDPGGLLLGTGKRMRHVKLRLGAEPDPAGLEALIVAAYADIRQRLRV